MPTWRHCAAEPDSSISHGLGDDNMPQKRVKQARRDQPLDNPSARRRVPRQRPQPPARKLSAAEKNELVEYFEERIARLHAVETTRTPSGQTLDWIDIRSQHPDGRIATPPPAPRIDVARQRGRPTKMARFELQEKGSRLGPEGTVPVFRTDPKKVRFNKTLDEF